MPWKIDRAGPGDADMLVTAGEDVFDHPVTDAGAAAFLADPAQLMVIARDGRRLLGFASGAFLRHPDKPLSLFVNEVSVRNGAHRQGIGRALVAAILDVGKQAGCGSAWVLTEHGNAPARGLYRAAGGNETEGVVMYEWDSDD